MEPLIPSPFSGCGSPAHWSRRTLLRAFGCSAWPWLTAVGDALALQEDRTRGRQPARHLILLWLGGAPSQLETFDPHPGSLIAFGTTDRPTAAPGIRIASGLERVAERMADIALVRSVVSREGDHERAFYNVKTGYRPNPALVHPSIGAVLCHEFPDAAPEIPTHVSILPNQWPARGGFLGAGFDAFQLGDPDQPLPDVRSAVAASREKTRLEDLAAVEQAFTVARPGVESRLRSGEIRDRARKMMTSAQLAALNVQEEPAAVRADYGDTPFGRGCLAARRLVEAGVQCVEVTLDGWDTHANNHELQAGRVAILDPAFAALLRDLKERDLLARTVVLCGGEFGRTPKLNALEGRDHWPHGFSVALAGGGIRGGVAVGATDPTGESKEPQRPVPVADLHATVMTALGIDPEYEIMTPAERPLARSEGRVIRELLG